MSTPTKRAKRIQEHIRHRAVAGRHEGLMEFIRGGITQGEEQRARGHAPRPGPRVAGHRLAQRAPEQQREHGILGQMSRLAHGELHQLQGFIRDAGNQPA